MRFIHLSDLHLGLRLNGFSLLGDQEYILRSILAVADAERPDAVLIAGDVYDKAVPSVEAVALFDDFLVRLAARCPVLAVSGNHDSPERLAFGGRLMVGGGVHIAPAYGGRTVPVTLEDDYGPVRFYLLPFVKPAHVRRFYPEEGVETATDALRSAIAHMELDKGARNVLVAHQFVTGAERSESEEVSVGGADNVDASVFAPFDYVALGHLHTEQWVERETVRYCGTPLKYSFSEAGRDKSVTVVDLGEKGEAAIRAVPLKPLHDMRRIRGTYLELTARETYRGTAVDDYLRVTLTDEEDIPDAVGKLRAIYPNLMKLDYDNARTRSSGPVGEAEEAEKTSPLELFARLYEKQNGQPMGREQEEFLRGLVEEIWEEDP